MEDDIVCSGCQANLTPRQLMTQTLVRESCPQCGETLRQEEGFRAEDVAAETAEDVAAVDAWLAAECDAARLQVEQDHAGVKDEFRWEIRGEFLAQCPDNWTLEVIHPTRTPGIIAVRINAWEVGHLRPDVLQKILAALRDHCLQPHGERTRSLLRDVRDDQSRWGAEQYLATATLSPGLLRPVVTRLLRAMRDAMTTRNLARPKDV